MCDSKKLGNYCSFSPIQSFLLPCAKRFANNCSERSSRMAGTLNETEMSETQWVVLKKIDHDYPGIFYRFAGFGNSRPLNLRGKGKNATVEFPRFLPFVINTQWYLVEWNTATEFREKPSSFRVKYLKNSHSRLCRTNNFLREDKFQRYYHWKIYCRRKDADWDNDRRHVEIFFEKTSLCLKTTPSILKTLT